MPELQAITSMEPHTFTSRAVYMVTVMAGNQSHLYFGSSVKYNSRWYKWNQKKSESTMGKLISNPANTVTWTVIATSPTCGIANEHNRAALPVTVTSLLWLRYTRA